MIPVFESTHPTWSYVKTTDDGVVTKAVEKEVISSNATAGIYYFKDGHDYIRGTEAMIRQNNRTNGLFYVCPVYDELIDMSRKIEICMVDKMCGLGTPAQIRGFQTAFGKEGKNQ